MQEIQIVIIFTTNEMFFDWLSLVNAFKSHLFRMM